MVRYRTVVATVAAIGTIACVGHATEPPRDCSDMVGALFIQLAPQVSGTFADYEITVGDSIQVTAEVRRVDSATLAFNPQQGHLCAPSASTRVAATVSFTGSSDRIGLLADGWIRGLRPGLATVIASSANPSVSAEFGVIVISR